MHKRFSNMQQFYKLLDAFDFDFIGLEIFQLLQTDITPEKKCSNDYCFSLALFIFPIMFARVYLRINIKEYKHSLDISYFC